MLMVLPRYFNDISDKLHNLPGLFNQIGKNKESWENSIEIEEFIHKKW